MLRNGAETYFWTHMLNGFGPGTDFIIGLVNDSSFKPMHVPTRGHVQEHLFGRYCGLYIFLFFNFFFLHCMFLGLHILNTCNVNFYYRWKKKKKNVTASRFTIPSFPLEILQNLPGRFFSLYPEKIFFIKLSYEANFLIRSLPKKVKIREENN